MSYSPDSLAGRHILVVEDEYYLADHFQAIIESAGGTVAGPLDAVEDTLRFLADDPRSLSAASLDVTLIDGKVYPVADRLRALGIPFAFATGGGPADIPERFADAPLVRKPLSPDELGKALLLLAA